ncbi:MAG: GNAT family N-acetyltransferase [Minisyncoccota bacterium]
MSKEITVIDLKKATSDDIEELLTFERSVDGVKTYSAITDKEEFLAELQYNYVFIIENNGQAVGSVMYEIKSPDHAYISGLVIDTRFQGKGLAREAMIKLLKELEHYKRIDLVTHPENERAIKLYESFGFIIESRKENYFGDGEPRIVMAKVLK